MASRLNGFGNAQDVGIKTAFLSVPKNILAVPIPSLPTLAVSSLAVAGTAPAFARDPAVPTSLVVGLVVYG